MKKHSIQILILFLFLLLCACNEEPVEIQKDPVTAAGYYQIKTIRSFDEACIFLSSETVQRNIPISENGVLRFPVIHEETKDPYYMYYDETGIFLSSENTKNDINLVLQEVNPTLFPDSVIIEGTRTFSDGIRAVLTFDREREMIQVHTFDAECHITASSTEVSVPIDQVSRFRLMNSGNDYLIVYDEANFGQFYIFDRTPTLRGTFTTASQLSDCYAPKDGTVILCCDDFSTMQYDPVSESVTPVTLYRETETSLRAKQILYTDDAVYFVDETGITEQCGSEETLLFTWETSGIGTSGLTIIEAFSDRWFLAWKQNTAMDTYAPAILFPAESSLREDKTEITLASMMCYPDESRFIAETVETFNQENADYYVIYNDYDNIAVDSKYTDSFAQSKAREKLLKDALMNGEHFDVFLFGSMNDPAPFIDILNDKELLCDLSALADAVGIADGIRRSVTENKQGEIPLLPVTGQLSILLAKEETLPQGEAFTLDKLQGIVDGLSDGQTLFGLDVSMQILAMIQGDMVDTDLGVCYFDDPRFLDAMDWLGNLKVDFQVKSTKYYDITIGGLKGGQDKIALDFDIYNNRIDLADSNTNSIGKLNDGTLQFLSCKLVNADSVAGLFYIMDLIDGKARICGYPTLFDNTINPNGCGYFTSSLVAGMMPGTDETESGAMEFLQMLYSDNVQCNSILSQYGLPVTEQALQKLIGEGYYYFQYGGVGA